jgi:sortase A
MPSSKSTKRKNRKPNPAFRRSATTKFNKKYFKINSLPNLLIFIGLCFLTAGLLILFFTFYPAVKEEIKYKIITSSKNHQKITEIKPVNADFGIVIPKIGANAKIIANVNPYDEKIYQKALTQGVAHAEGTAFPGAFGNTFLFAHSSADWYSANTYNSIFYLINKLEKDDEIDLYYLQKKYRYLVVEKKIIDPGRIDYLSSRFSQKMLTLMTCWPPGTTLKRLIIIAKLVF